VSRLLGGAVTVVTGIPLHGGDLSLSLSLGLTAAGNGATAASVVFVSLSLSLMSEYAELNAAYAPLFVPSHLAGAPFPARAAVEGLERERERESETESEGERERERESEGDAFMDLVLIPGPRRHIHVQSVSHWAPASIGPYSQASLTPRGDFIAGQIGLDPWTMSLAGPGREREAEQAALNVAAILADGGQVGAPVALAVCRVDESPLSRSLIRRIVSLIPGSDADRLVERKVRHLPKGASLEIIAIASAHFHPLDVIHLLFGETEGE
jgi:diphthine-ammonia ligase